MRIQPCALDVRGALHRRVRPLGGSRARRAASGRPATACRRAPVLRIVTLDDHPGVVTQPLVRGGAERVGEPGDELSLVSSFTRKSNSSTLISGIPRSSSSRRVGSEIYLAAVTAATVVRRVGSNRRMSGPRPEPDRTAGRLPHVHRGDRRRDRRERRRARAPDLRGHRGALRRRAPAPQRGLPRGLRRGAAAAVRRVLAEAAARSSAAAGTCSTSS